MTVSEAWKQMCEDYLEGHPEAEGLEYIVEAISGGGYGEGGMLQRPITAASLAKYLERMADANGTWGQIVELMTQDLEEGEELSPDTLMYLTDITCCGLEARED